jgi:lipopolysaccharide exporter
MAVTKAKTFRNIVYTSAAKGVALVCVALTSSVVARNLTPADFGVFGFAAIIVGFLARFSDMGIGSAAIRQPQLDNQALQTAFTLKIILGSFAFVAAWFVAPLARHVFDHPATANVIRVLSVSFLLSTVGFVSLVQLTRQMNYKALAIPGIASTIVRSAIAIGLVLHGWKYWSIVLADVGATLISGLVMTLIYRTHVGIGFDRKYVKELLRFGIPLFGSGILVFVIFNLDNFLVGTALGSIQLGYYALAFTWGSFVCVLLSDTVNNVLFPTFSSIQHDHVSMRRWYLKTVDLVAFVAVVVNTALLSNVHFFLTTFLGKGTDKWAPAATSLKILCIYGIVRAITEPLGNCIMAQGRTNMLLHASGIAGAVELALILTVLRTGRIELIAVAVLIAYGAQAAIYLPYLRREFSVGLGDLVAQLWPVVPALIGGYVITSFLPNSFGTTVFTLACRGFFTAAVVILVHGLCTGFRCLEEAGGMIFEKFARARA